MVFSVKCVLMLCCFGGMTVYLIMAANEDSRSYQVTRWKHLIGFFAASIIGVSHMKDKSLLEIGMTMLFVLLMFILGMIGVYGMADGFVFANLTLLLGSIGGIAGIGLVILIMILACVSAMLEMLFRKMVNIEGFKQNVHIAFVPHILAGFLAALIALLIWL